MVDRLERILRLLLTRHPESDLQPLNDVEIERLRNRFRAFPSI
ncbi:hypothetical protein FRUB_03797 [Fimbriiglobus ruber]|uniref:Uncharacterized protein n=1 Tax=Fimbriiglobus ruber TaxID=1908690 RepID=A0A225DWZ6_9BACT|nr:hypothetical protein FRUB_03797 [Fimbriiglobus ruber]